MNQRELNLFFVYIKIKLNNKGKMLKGDVKWDKEGTSQPQKVLCNNHRKRELGKR